METIDYSPDTTETHDTLVVPLEVRRSAELQLYADAPTDMAGALERLDKPAREGMRPRSMLVVGNEKILDQEVDIIDYREQGFVQFNMHLVTKDRYGRKEAGLEELKNTFHKATGEVGAIATEDDLQGIGKTFAVQHNGMTLRLGKESALGKGFVQIDIPQSLEAPMDPKALEDKVSETLKTFYGMQEGIISPTPETEQASKELHYRTQHLLDAHIKDRFSFNTDETAPLTPEQQQEIGHMFRSEVSDGYWTHVQPGKSLEYQEKYGEYGVYHEASADDAVSVIKNGMLSILELSRRGLRASRYSSAGRDVETGGSESVFTRTVTEKGVTGEHADKDHALGGVIFVLRPEVYERTDWYAFPGDNYGAIEGGLHNRQSADEILSQQQEKGFYHSNEQMFSTGVEPELMAGVVCIDPLTRTRLIESLRQEGMNEVNGLPLEKFVVAASHVSDLIDVAYGRSPRSGTSQEVVPLPPPPEPVIEGDDVF